MLPPMLPLVADNTRCEFDYIPPEYQEAKPVGALPDWDNLNTPQRTKLNYTDDCYEDYYPHTSFEYNIDRQRLDKASFMPIFDCNGRVGTTMIHRAIIDYDDQWAKFMLAFQQTRIVTDVCDCQSWTSNPRHTLTVSYDPDGIRVGQEQYVGIKYWDFVLGLNLVADPDYASDKMHKHDPFPIWKGPSDKLVSGVYQYTPEYGYYCGKLSCIPEGDCWFLAATELIGVKKWINSHTAPISNDMSVIERRGVLFYERGTALIDGVKIVEGAKIVNARIEASLDKIFNSNIMDTEIDAKSGFISNSCIDNSSIDVDIIQVRNSTVEVQAICSELILTNVQGAIQVENSYSIINTQVRQVTGTFKSNGCRVKLFDCIYPNYDFTLIIESTHERVLLDSVIFAPGQPGQDWNGQECRITVSVGVDFLPLDIPTNSLEPFEGDVYPGGRLSLERKHTYEALFSLPKGFNTVENKAIPIGVYNIEGGNEPC